MTQILIISTAQGDCYRRGNQLSLKGTAAMPDLSGLQKRFYLKGEGWRYFQLNGNYKSKTYAEACADFVDTIEEMIAYEIKDSFLITWPTKPGSDRDNRSIR